MAACVPVTPVTDTEDSATGSAVSGRVPLHFEANRGQAGDEVQLKGGRQVGYDRQSHENGSREDHTAGQTLILWECGARLLFSSLRTRDLEPVQEERSFNKGHCQV